MKSNISLFFDFSYLKTGQSYGRNRIKREALQTVENRLLSLFGGKGKTVEIF
jgi:hypothetical protein